MCCHGESLTWCLWCWAEAWSIRPQPLRLVPSCLRASGLQTSTPDPSASSAGTQTGPSQLTAGWDSLGGGEGEGGEGGRKRGRRETHTLKSDWVVEKEDKSKCWTRMEGAVGSGRVRFEEGGENVKMEYCHDNIQMYVCMYAQGIAYLSPAHFTRQVQVYSACVLCNTYTPCFHEDWAHFWFQFLMLQSVHWKWEHERQCVWIQRVRIPTLVRCAIPCFLPAGIFAQ